jgi:hypothetical protein
VFDLDLNDIKAGVDYLRVLGKSLASGAFLVTQMVVYADEYTCAASD